MLNIHFFVLNSLSEIRQYSFNRRCIIKRIVKDKKDEYLFIEKRSRITIGIFDKLYQSKYNSILYITIPNILYVKVSLFFHIISFSSRKSYICTIMVLSIHLKLIPFCVGTLLTNQCDAVRC